MNVYITPQGARNIADIGRYVGRHSQTGSRRVKVSIQAAIRLAAEHPDIGFLMTTKGIRRIVASRFGYLIYYIVDEARDEVVVLSVKHPARKRDYDPS